MVPRKNKIGSQTGFASRKSFLLGLVLLLGISCMIALPQYQSVSAQLPGVNSQSIELDVKALSSTRVNLSWRINRPDVIGSIRIYRAHYVTPDFFTQLVSLPATALSYVDTVEPGSTWIYRIQTTGRKPTQFSAPSNAVKVTTPETDPKGPSQQEEPTTGTNQDPALNNPIQTLSARALSANQIELAWAIPSLAHVASLRIYRASSEDPKNFAYLDAIGANLNRYVDANLKPKTTYYYQIKYNLNSHSALLSPPSNTAMATTPDGAAPNSRAKYAHLRPTPGIPFELPAFGLGSAAPLDDHEEELLFLINQYRAQRGLGPVRASIALCQASDLLSKDMAATGELNRYDSFGRSTANRVRGYGYFPPSTNFDTIVAANRSEYDYDALGFFFENLKGLNAENEILLNPAWKVVGIARQYNGGSWFWAFDFAAYWDKTVPLPGEDTDGRIEGNERVRTRPPADALAANAKFTGYGDDGKPYSPVHCDLETNECWRDPVQVDQRSLRQRSLPDNMIGTWHLDMQVGAKGVAHQNDREKYDMTQFTMTMMINRDGTWVSQGYKAYQDPTPSEAGTWKWVHDAARNEEVVTFFRDNGKTAVTLRVHATKGLMRFYAVDGGDFFKAVPADSNPKDDPQVIFTPGPGFYMVPTAPFPASMRCAACPRA